MWVWGEAWRNIVSGTSRAVLNASLWVALVGTLALAEVLGTDQILRQAADFRAAGASVQVLSAAGLVSGAACDRLNDLPGVGAAGALSLRQDSVTLSALPKGPVAAFDVTDSLAALLPLTADDGGAGVWVSSDVADGLGIRPGDSIASPTGDIRVRGVFAWPDDGRRRGFGYAMLIPRPDDHVFDECWLDAWPPVDNARALLRATLVPHPATAETNVTVAQLNTSLGLRFDGQQRFDTRLTRFAPWAAAVAALVLSLVALRLRRLELAAARHAGMTGGQQFVQLLAETAWWLLWAVVLATGAVILAVEAGSGQAAGQVAGVGWLVVAHGALGSVAGVVLGVWSVREEHLFRYFKMGR